MSSWSAKTVNDYIDRHVAGMLAICENWGGTLESYAKATAPWTDRTSHARQSLHGGAESDGSSRFIIFLSHGVEYGGALEEGGKPHTIVVRPVRAKALYWPGAKHPVKGPITINHPGSKPYPVIEPTMDAHVARIRQSIADYWGTTK